MILDRITLNPNRVNGQPTIRNMRLTVRRVIKLVATYPDRYELFQEFPELEWEDMEQALLYEEACRKAREAAIDPNYGSRTFPGFNSSVPHQLSDLIWNNAYSSSERLHLFFVMYAEMPCYGLLMYLNMNFGDFTDEAKAMLWAWMRETLASDDAALAPPLAYSLWCDFLEDPQTVEETWNALVHPLPADKTLQQILLHSGPVPYALKQELYDRLIRDEKWHSYIYRSLLHSNCDVYGDLDKEAARRILGRLRLSKETEYLEEFRELIHQ